MGSCRVARFDVSMLSAEQLHLFTERLEFKAFMTQIGAPHGKIISIDGFFENEPNLPELLKGFEFEKYIDNKGMLYKVWKNSF